MPRILFVEDELNLQTSIGFILEREGHQVTCVGTGEDALLRAHESPPDLVLLDINLPGMDGFAVCQHLRARPETAAVPIILVTGRTSVDDVVHGFAASADDYVTKPFHPRVLLARVDAVLRRGSGRPSGDAAPLAFGGLTIDPTSRVVRLDGLPLPLTKTEFDLVYLFATHPDRVFTRSCILDAVRGLDIAVTERTVDFQVSGLRRKLGLAARHVETVRGVGYKFVL